MRLHILTTASALLLLTLFTSQAHGQGPELPTLTPSLIQSPETPCSICRTGLIAKVNPHCPEAIKYEPATPIDASSDPIEAFKQLPSMTGACQCVIASRGFLDPCAGSDVCGPTSDMLQRNLDNFAELCKIVGTAEAAARRNGTYTATNAAPPGTITGGALSAGLVAVAAAVAAVAL